MILKDYNIFDSFKRYKNGILVKEERHDLADFKYQGYFQNHKLGTIILVTEIERPFFVIDDLVVHFNELREIKYEAVGENRYFSFKRKSCLTSRKFIYKTFWIDEVAMLEFALGYPDDILEDIVKKITVFGEGLISSQDN